MGARLLTLAQLVGLALLVGGVALWSVPAALIVTGLVVVAACEFADDGRPTPPKQPPGDLG